MPFLGLSFSIYKVGVGEFLPVAFLARLKQMQRNPMQVTTCRARLLSSWTK